jgi:Asp-tRNA(Asn)/Glu-tRNA(Gln) amidotransferase A subunit family amidase
MTRNVSSLVAVTKAIVDARPWEQDPKCCPVPWRSEVFEEARTRPLVVAIMRDDGVVRCHPPISRVLEEVAVKLEKAGHEVIEWIPGTLHQECIDIMVSPLKSTHHSELTTTRTNTTPRMVAKTSDETLQLVVNPLFRMWKLLSRKDRPFLSMNTGS